MSIPVHKTGIMGGTFDPIHIGHLFLAEQAYDQLGLDTILFIPSGNPPHKRHREGRATDRQRVDMVRLAIKGNPHFALSLTEMEQEGYSYTYQTLERLRAEHPDTAYTFIIGEDSLLAFETWREPQRICDACTLAVAIRSERTAHSLAKEIAAVSQRLSGTFTDLHTPFLEISSEAIRTSVREKRSIRYLVPEAVRLYIEEHQIYQEV